MAERIAMSSQALDAAVADIARGVDRIEGQLEDLRTYLAPVRASWGGSAAQAWGAYQRQWDGASAGLVRELAGIRQLVAAAHHRYAATEEVNVGMWRL